ncbi:MAG: hypothetical protein IJG38_01185, partial [Thermoguttaceae bacterium]|nr:hypothetical protein [Thermoguttaceae bacterium]
PRLPMEQRLGDNLCSARIAAISAKKLTLWFAKYAKIKDFFAFFAAKKYNRERASDQRERF